MIPTESDPPPKAQATTALANRGMSARVRSSGGNGVLSVYGISACGGEPAVGRHHGVRVRGAEMRHDGRMGSRGFQALARWRVQLRISGVPSAALMAASWAASTDELLRLERLPQLCVQLELLLRCERRRELV